MSAEEEADVNFHISFTGMDEDDNAAQTVETLPVNIVGNPTAELVTEPIEASEDTSTIAPQTEPEKVKMEEEQLEDLPLDDKSVPVYIAPNSDAKSELTTVGVRQQVKVVLSSGKLTETFMLNDDTTVLGLKHAVLNECGFPTDHSHHHVNVILKGKALSSNTLLLSTLRAADEKLSLPLFAIVDGPTIEDDHAIAQRSLSELQLAAMETKEVKKKKVVSVETRLKHNRRQSNLVLAKKPKIEGEYKISRYGDIIKESKATGGLALIEEVNTNVQSKRAVQTKALVRDIKRDDKWITMLADWANFEKKQPQKLKERTRKGIPSTVRRFVWPMLANIAEFKYKSGNKEFYQQLLTKSLPQEHDIQIKKDLPRVMQDHVLFKSPETGSRTVVCSGQLAMYNVFKAISLYDPEMGYVQGMSSIVGPALMYMEEEDAFWLLVTLLNSHKHHLRGLYIDGMPLAFEFMHVYEQLLSRVAPRLCHMLQERMIIPQTYAFRWLTTRFHLFPTELVLRILDVFVNEGMKIIYRVALWIMLHYQTELLAMDDDANIIRKLQDIQHEPVMQDSDYVIAQALKVKITTAQINNILKQYKKQMA